jgi:hypothetical protein
MLDVIEGRFCAIRAFLLDRLRNPNLWVPRPLVVGSAGREGQS